MFEKLLRLHRGRRGVTGLETAIILIAFVVVASVFAYTVLSAGIFSSQKSQEAVHAGVEKARGSMEPRGDLTAYKGTVGATDTVVKVAFTVTSSLAGTRTDMTPPYTATATDLTSSGLDHVTVVSYSDRKQYISDAAWTLSWAGKNNGDYMLDPGEKAIITVWLVNYTASAYALGAGAGDPFIDSAGNLLAVYNSFNLEVKPLDGATLALERSLPGKLDTVMNLK